MSIHSPEIFVEQSRQALGAVVEFLQQSYRHLQVRGSLSYPVPHALEGQVAKAQPAGVFLLGESLDTVVDRLTGIVAGLGGFVAPGSQQEQLARAGAVFFAAVFLLLAQDREVARDGLQQDEAHLAGPLQVPQADDQGALPAQLEKQLRQAADEVYPGRFLPAFVDRLLCGELHLLGKQRDDLAERFPAG